MVSIPRPISFLTWAMSYGNGTDSADAKLDPEIVAGPAFIGIVINWGLLGILLAQVLAYHRSYHHRDRPFIKWLVYTTCLLEIMFTVTLTHYSYRLSITSLVHPEHLTRNTWSAGMLTLSCGTISCLVQSFFAWRAWRLTKGSIAFTLGAIMIVVLAFTQLGASLAFTFIYGTRYHFDYTQIRGAVGLRVATLTQLPCAVVADLMIAVMMLVLLRRAKRRPQVLRQTATLLNWLITLTVGTGLVTAIAAFLFFLFALPTMQGSNLHTAFALFLGKLYSTMLLANLNGRGLFGASDSMTVRLHQTDDMELPTTGTARSRSYQQEIRVSTHVHKDFGPEKMLADSRGEVTKAVAL